MAIAPDEWMSRSAGASHASARTSATTRLALSEAIHFSVCLFGKPFLRLRNGVSAVS